jgi:phosphoacetylglucosamine mutase
MMSSTPALDPEVLPPCLNLHEVQRLLDKYPPIIRYDYGTAGFRHLANVLDPVMVRVAVVATRLASSELPHRSVGVMITASHNTAEYNGVKLADSSGGMMPSASEEMAIRYANVAAEDVLSFVKQHFSSSGVTPSKAVVHIGCDTRESSPSLASLLIRTVRKMGGTVINHGVVTTPQLHHCVLHDNYDWNCAQRIISPSFVARAPNVRGYYELVASSYLSLINTSNDRDASPGPRSLVVDCACGVGFPHLQALQQRLTSLNLVCANAPGSGPLNEGCGSEHVQKTQDLPKWYDLVDHPLPSLRYCASLDGDADRIVFFTSEDDTPFALLDGDKIACLCCAFLQAQLDSLEGITQSLPKLGVVQTAYANGASTAYLKDVMGEDRVKIAKTGVKHVHKVAHEEFDIGVYFESNGHGTILFGHVFYEFLEQTRETACKNRGEAALAWKRLSLLPSLVNQAVGDAISDLLLVDAILFLQDMPMQDWIGLYTDLPSRQVKVQVKDRTVITTNFNETKCLTPTGVQPELDVAMTTYSGRAFVRPSGTEDVVRVYAEAPTQGAADALASEAVAIVRRLSGGSVSPPVSKM